MDQTGTIKCTFESICTVDMSVLVFRTDRRDFKGEWGDTCTTLESRPKKLSPNCLSNYNFCPDAWYKYYVT